MITIEKLNIFRKYQGDGDAFIRAGKKKEQSVMDYSDWRMIDEFIQGISLIKNELASERFEESLTTKLKDYCENQSVIDELWRIF
jgi:hypothetical protein